MPNYENQTVIFPEAEVVIEPVINEQVWHEQNDAEVAYSYTRNDGTVEFARTREEAFGKCPILGKLAVESPDLAQMFLDLAASGKKSHEEEVKQEAELARKQAEAAAQKAKDQASQQSEAASPAPAKSVTETNIEPRRYTKPEAPQTDYQKPAEQAIILAQTETRNESVVEVIEPTVTPTVEELVSRVEATKIEIEHRRAEELREPDTSAIQQEARAIPEPAVIEHEVRTKPLEAILVPTVLASAATTRAIEKLAQLVERPSIITSAEINPAQLEQPIDPDTAIPQEVRFATYDIPTEPQSTYQYEATVENDYTLPPVQEFDQTTIDTTFYEIVQALGVADNESGTATEATNALVFDEETLETFDAIMALAANQAAKAPANPTEADELSASVSFEEDLTPIEPIPPAMTNQQLEAAIERLMLDLEPDLAEAEAETIESLAPAPLALEFIVEQADDQPAEETLTQLITNIPEVVAGIKIIVEDLDDSEIVEDRPEPENEIVNNDVAYEIISALHELDIAIAANQPLKQVATEALTEDAENLEAIEEPAELVLTPLITERILDLLSVLGYEDPQQALMHMAETQGVAATLQILQRAAQLITRDDYHEIMNFIDASASDTSKVIGSQPTTATARFGQALLWIAHKFSLEREAASDIRPLASAIV